MNHSRMIEGCLVQTVSICVSPVPGDPAVGNVLRIKNPSGLVVQMLAWPKGLDPGQNFKEPSASQGWTWFYSSSGGHRPDWQPIEWAKRMPGDLSVPLEGLAFWKWLSTAKTGEDVAFVMSLAASQF